MQNAREKKDVSIGGVILTIIVCVVGYFSLFPAKSNPSNQEYRKDVFLERAARVVAAAVEQARMCGLDTDVANEARNYWEKSFTNEFRVRGGDPQKWKEISDDAFKGALLNYESIDCEKAFRRFSGLQGVMLRDLQGQLENLE